MNKDFPLKNSGKRRKLCLLQNWRIGIYALDCFLRQNE
ncbi:hypothetical protein ykris0001_44930 [Yersinia kristensenii ATCC 33638]|nr:hypothetical protein ykris0001_44930 [Yersinia kristensenii ATCC 33638]